MRVLLLGLAAAACAGRAQPRPDPSLEDRVSMALACPAGQVRHDMVGTVGQMRAAGCGKRVGYNSAENTIGNVRADVAGLGEVGNDEGAPQ